MAYSTVTMVRRALAPTPDGSETPSPPSGTAADLTTAQLTDCIAEADSIINGYLRTLYTVPVATSGDPAVAAEPVNFWSRDIACYLATLIYRGSLDFGDDDPVVRRYKQAMGMLRDVSTGKMVLDLPTAASGVGETAQGEAGSAINPYQGELWTPDDFSVQQASGQPNSDGSWRPPFFPGWW